MPGAGSPCRSRVAVIGLVVGGCGDPVDSSSPGATAPAGRSLDLGRVTSEPQKAIQPLKDAPISPLPAGSYRTTVGPAVTFTVDDRWDLEAMNEDGAGLLFGSYSPMEVTAPRADWIDLDQADARIVPDRDRRTTGAFDQDYAARWDPIPRDLAGWFANQSGLDVGPVEPVEIGGATGQSFSFTVPSAIQNSEACVVWPCLRLIGGGDWAWVAPAGRRRPHLGGRGRWSHAADPGPRPTEGRCGGDSGRYRGGGVHDVREWTSMSGAGMRTRMSARTLVVGSLLIALGISSLAGLLRASGFGETARSQVSDTTAASVDADRRVVVVALDADFFDYMDDQPWGVAALANALGYEVGGLTRTFLVRDEVLKMLNPGMAETEFDVVAGQVLKDLPSAVVGRTEVVVLNGGADAVPKVIGPEPTATLRSGVDGVAFDSAAPNGAQGVIRSAALVASQDDGDRLVPSTALLSLIRADDLPARIDVRDGLLQVGGRAIPVDGNDRMRVSFSKDLLPGGSAIVPMRKVIEGKADDALLKDATVLVGVTDPNRARMVEVPQGAGGELPAVLVDANAVNTLFTGAFQQPVSPFATWLVMFVVALLVTLGSMTLPLPASPIVPVAVGASVWLGALLSARSGAMVDVLAIYVVIGSAFVATLAWRAVQELLRRRRLVGLFSQYVPATVARQLIQPDRLREMTDGQRVEVSVLFCDLRGFTPMCARLEPSEVRVVLDRFYAAASEVILTRGGTVMHFNGDEVFGVFGAPIEQPDHAVRAIDAAAALLDLRSQELELDAPDAPDAMPPFGIGVNSGQVVAAHVGSDARRQYTVIGEPVNIAARLCSAASGDEAVVAEATVLRAGGDLRLQPMEPLTLKGIARKVQAHRLVPGAIEDAPGVGGATEVGLRPPVRPVRSVPPHGATRGVAARR